MNTRFIKNILFSHRCICCGTSLELSDKGFVCPNCIGLIKEDTPMFSQFETLDMVVSCQNYVGTVKQLIHKYKYSCNKSIGDFFAERAAVMCAEFPKKPDFITYVPTFGHERGRFNQSQYLAWHIAREMKIPCKKLLFKTRRTPSQTQCLSFEKRRQNVRGAFYAVKNLSNGACVLIADDVYTTGSTLGDCARALLDGGASSVFGITIAKTTLNNTPVHFEFSNQPPQKTLNNIPYNASALLKKGRRIQRKNERRKRLELFFDSRKDNLPL